MRVPKLTKARFFLLWAVGVVIFFFISWKAIFSSDKNVPNGRFAADEWKASKASMLYLNGHLAVRPPSSVVDAMKPNDVARHQDQNAKGVDDEVPALEGDSSDDDVSFLHVPHQEMEDDSKFLSEKNPKAIAHLQEVHGEAAPDTSSQSSDVSSQDQHVVTAETSKSIKTGLFEEAINRDHPSDGGESWEAELNVPYKNQNHHGYSNKLPEGSSNQIDEVGEDAGKPGVIASLTGENINPLPKVSPQDTENDGVTMPHIGQTHFRTQQGAPPNVPHEKMGNEADVGAVKSPEVGPLSRNPTNPDVSHQNQENEGVDTPHGGQTHFAPRTAPHEDKRNKIPKETAKSGKTDLLNKQYSLHPPPDDLPQYNPHKEQTPGMSFAVPHRDNIQKVPVGSAEARDTHLLDNRLQPQPSNAHLAESKTNVEQNQIVPTSEPREAGRNEVAMGAVSNLQNEINQPIRDDVTDHRPLDVNPLTKDAVRISEDRPALQDVAKPGRVVEFRQPQQPALTGNEKVRSDTGTERVIPPENETEEQFMQRMEEVQRKRHARLQQKCLSTYNLTPLDFQRDRQKILSWKRFYEHAYANDDHQFIICRELKAASFSWRKVMISLYAKGSPSYRRSQKQGDFPIRDFDDDTFMDKLSRYGKILFIREPFARFLSAYRDKYVELRHFPYYQPIGMKIIQKYRKNPSPGEIQSGRPTFEEFTRWVVTEEVPEGDYHWRPLFNWYHPCQIPYEYIGKVETAVEDARYIFKMIGIDKLETFPSTETHHRFSSSADVLQEFYSQLSPDLLPLLIQRYKEEFELFDYPIPQKMSDIWTRR